jgi:hypothetical protein
MPNQTLQTGFRAVCDVIAEKQFREMEKNRPYYDAMLLNTPSGKEKQEFQIGDSVISKGTGTYKAGVQMIVADAYKENGYWKYVCAHGKMNKKTGNFQFNCTERQKDLAKV